MSKLYKFPQTGDKLVLAEDWKFPLWRYNDESHKYKLFLMFDKTGLGTPEQPYLAGQEVEVVLPKGTELTLWITQHHCSNSGKIRFKTVLFGEKVCFSINSASLDGLVVEE